MRRVTAVGFVCGPAKGTEAKPYRCICCRVAYADIEALMVSICVLCMAGNLRCRRCRSRGVPVSDFRVGKWRKYRDTMRYYPNGGLLHRVRRVIGSSVAMNCGKRIPYAHLGGGEAVVPPCRFCWPRGFGY